MRLAVLLVLVALPAAAQDVTIDGHWIDRCLAIQDDPMRCVGRATETCVESSTSAAMSVEADCMGAELAIWDASLNDAYRGLQRLAVEREGWDVGYPQGSLTGALRDMQRAWIGYRDASCDHARVLASPYGSEVGRAVTECLMFQTARQNFVLRDMRFDYLDRETR